MYNKGGDPAIKIKIINGPNLNFIGIREPEVYGKLTFDDMNKLIAGEFQGSNTVLEFMQSNSEGEIIDYLQQCHFDNTDGIVLNPGAYTHYSYAIRDAISSIHIPVIEVHLTNTSKREEFREKSVTAAVCAGQIKGFSWYSYVLAILALKKMM